MPWGSSPGTRARFPHTVESLSSGPLIAPRPDDSTSTTGNAQCALQKRSGERSKRERLERERERDRTRDRRGREIGEREIGEIGERDRRDRREIGGEDQREREREREREIGERDALGFEPGHACPMFPDQLQISSR